MEPLDPEYLSAVIADGYVLAQTAKRFHWLVRGSDFFVLHEQFEQMYDYWNDTVDLLAERQIALGGTPPSTVAALLGLSTIGEPETNQAATAISSMVTCLNHMISMLQDKSKLAIDVGDTVTANILDEILAAQQKKLWMFSAYLGEAPLSERIRAVGTQLVQ